MGNAGARQICGCRGVGSRSVCGCPGVPWDNQAAIHDCRWEGRVPKTVLACVFKTGLSKRKGLSLMLHSAADYLAEYERMIAGRERGDDPALDPPERVHQNRNARCGSRLRLYSFQLLRCLIGAAPQF